MTKFLDERGRLFGLINPVDLIIILVLLGLGIKILTDRLPASLDLREKVVTLGVVARNAPPYLGQSLVVGQDLFQDGPGAWLGKIYLKRAEPAEILLANDDRLTLVKSPRNQDLYLELRRKGRVVTGPARAGVYLGRLPVRVGDKISAHTLYTSVTVEIISLKVKPYGK